MGASFIGVLAAGGIAGYLFARVTRKWTTHLRIGCMTGFLFLLVIGLLFAYSFTGFPEALGLYYSVTQAEVFEILFLQTIFLVVDYALLIGMGAVLGGTLRKLLKPAEQRPATVEGSGYYRSEMVNLRRKTWG